jgi:tetrachlorobenzoquinone reductase
MASNNAPINVRLRQIRQEAEGVCSYEFVASGQAPLPSFTAGAHIDLHLPQDRVRSYSIASSPERRDAYVIAVRLEAEGGGGSAWMHSQPRVGDRLRITPPSNDFEMADSAEEAVFFAGGIGITPILSMLHALEAKGRPWRLHYGGRNPLETPFVEELKAFDQGRGRVAFYFSETDGQRMDLAALVGSAPAASHLYCCGPASMIDAFNEAGKAAANARNPQTMHCERFAASAEAATEGGFDIVLQRSGQRIKVQPGKTILDCLLDNSVDVPYACSSGVCGTCRTGVVDGVPDHRDDYLTDDEKAGNQSVMVCCSGSKTATLVLDL